MLEVGLRVFLLLCGAFLFLRFIVYLWSAKGRLLLIEGAMALTLAVVPIALFVAAAIFLAPWMADWPRGIRPLLLFGVVTLLLAAWTLSRFNPWLSMFIWRQDLLVAVEGRDGPWENPRRYKCWIHWVANSVMVLCYGGFLCWFFMNASMIGELGVTIGYIIEPGELGPAQDHLPTALNISDIKEVAGVDQFKGGLVMATGIFLGLALVYVPLLLTAWIGRQVRLGLKQLERRMEKGERF